MQVRARVNPVSYIHKDWHGKNHPRGHINGVEFTRMNGAYYSDVLNQEQVAALADHPHVTLEITAVDVGRIEAPLPSAEPVAVPVEPVQSPTVILPRPLKPHEWQKGKRR